MGDSDEATRVLRGLACGRCPAHRVDGRVSTTGQAKHGEAEVTIERDQPGQPHKGKMLAAIQPHCDDVPIFAGGTILKLIAEGYRGIMIRTSNDEMAGRGATIGEVILNNERDTIAVTRLMGLEKSFDLGYRNHLMDGTPRLEMRHGSSSSSG